MPEETKVATETTESVAEQSVAEENVGTPSAEKTYTDKELTAIVKRKIEKTERDILGKFGAKDKAELESLLPYIEAGRAAEEAQKTEAERFTAALEKKDKEYAAALSAKDERISTLEASLSAYEQEKAVSAANVDPEWQELAIYKSKALVNDDTDFKAALEIVLKENPKYVTTKPQPAPYTIPGMGKTKSTQTKADLNQIIFGINTKRG